MKLLENMVGNVKTDHETQYYYINLNGLVCHVDIT